MIFIDLTIEISSFSVRRGFLMLSRIRLPSLPHGRSFRGAFPAVNGELLRHALKSASQERKVSSPIGHLCDSGPLEHNFF